MERIPDLVAANPLVMGLLEYVLEKRDEQILCGDERPIALTLDPKNAPRALRAALAPLTDPAYDDGELWDELRWVAEDRRLFSIKNPQRRSVGNAAWQGARLYFDDRAEALVRDWLQRPRPLRQNPEWLAALAEFAPRFANPEAFPPDGPELDPGFADYRELLTCWASVGTELARGGAQSWRQLSARCFLGDSKYLDSAVRQALLRGLFPAQSGKVSERPLLLHLYLPAQVQQVLLVENQDSFLWLADRAPAATALVYIEGYRGGAARVRQPGVTRFSTLNAADSEARGTFLAWWQGQLEQNWPVYFWGDLDYEGLQIAAALRHSFPTLQCWRPGFAPLLERLRRGGGHRPEQAGKARQKYIASTGCAFADGELLPALRESGRFVDQEALSADELDLEVAEL
ncbi:Wadjet anti-phage system protein JetD domain-containing protein [Microbulbifer sp. SAOS-129_SWC]|uniref:Wadjet anti-phage system protein JetD domain-containing protein n=1 Tax=Microbulbifer sp. SAOS-129_SWC TaxID=3145235 RepID=UPI003217747B